MHVGIFDSGVGGLTVLRALQNVFPSYRFTYLADRQNMPYGAFESETIRLFSEKNIKFLQSCGCDFIVVACHTASCALGPISSSEKPFVLTMNQPVIASLKPYEGASIIMLATPLTVYSQKYAALIKKTSSIDFIQISCPELALLIEQWDPCVLKHYAALYAYKIHQCVKTKCLTEKVHILWGCTHYSFMQDLFAPFLPPECTMIDPAFCVPEILSHLNDIPLPLYTSSHTSRETLDETSYENTILSLGAQDLGLKKTQSTPGVDFYYTGSQTPQEALQQIQKFWKSIKSINPITL